MPATEWLGFHFKHISVGLKASTTFVAENYLTLTYSSLRMSLDFVVL